MPAEQAPWGGNVFGAHSCTTSAQPASGTLVEASGVQASPAAPFRVVADSEPTVVQFTGTSVHCPPWSVTLAHLFMHLLST